MQSDKQVDKRVTFEQNHIIKFNYLSIQDDGKYEVTLINSAGCVNITNISH